MEAVHGADSVDGASTEAAGMEDKVAAVIGVVPEEIGVAQGVEEEEEASEVAVVVAGSQGAGVTPTTLAAAATTVLSTSLAARDLIRTPRLKNPTRKFR